MSIKIQVPAGANLGDNELSFIQQMGVHWLNLNLMPQEATAETIAVLRERYARYDLEISDLTCPPLQKNADIILGRSGRDEAIERFCDFVRLAGQCGVNIVSVAWQPNGIFRSGRGVYPHTRGGVSFCADMKEIEARPLSNGRIYVEDEIWANFAYFLECVIPVCEENNVRMALHPNDPPVPSLGGAASLIYNTACFERAFELAHQSPALGMKLCVGCWLEAGDAFGDLMRDIEEYCRRDKILVVHFRNVSGQMPYFEETLAEDGYADMYAIMKKFVECGYDGYMSIDHAFDPTPGMGGRVGACAYPTGHMKGLLYAAEHDPSVHH